jgi:hypothetical protein
VPKTLLWNRALLSVEAFMATETEDHKLVTVLLTELFNPKKE